MLDFAESHSSPGKGVQSPLHSRDEESKTKEMCPGSLGAKKQVGIRTQLGTSNPALDFKPTVFFPQLGALKIQIVFIFFYLFPSPAQIKH